MYKANIALQGFDLINKWDIVKAQPKKCFQLRQSREGLEKMEGFYYCLCLVGEISTLSHPNTLVTNLQPLGTCVAFGLPAVSTGSGINGL